MDPEQEKVKKFMIEAGLVIPRCPIIPSQEVQKLRLALIREELGELQDAFEDGDVVEVADAIADLTYVVKGTAIACGIDMESIFNEVHASNMTKFKDGVVVTEDGKVEKSSSFESPKIRNLLKRQTCDSCADHLSER